MTQQSFKFYQTGSKCRPEAALASNTATTTVIILMLNKTLESCNKLNYPLSQSMRVGVGGFCTLSISQET